MAEVKETHSSSIVKAINTTTEKTVTLAFQGYDDYEKGINGDIIRVRFRDADRTVSLIRGFCIKGATVRLVLTNFLDTNEMKDHKWLNRVCFRSFENHLALWNIDMMEQLSFLSNEPISTIRPYLGPNTYKNNKTIVTIPLRYFFEHVKPICNGETYFQVSLRETSKLRCDKLELFIDLTLDLIPIPKFGSNLLLSSHIWFHRLKLITKDFFNDTDSPLKEELIDLTFALGIISSKFIMLLFEFKFDRQTDMIDVSNFVEASSASSIYKEIQKKVTEEAYICDEATFQLVDAVDRHQSIKYTRKDMRNEYKDHFEFFDTQEDEKLTESNNRCYYYIPLCTKSSKGTPANELRYLDVDPREQVFLKLKHNWKHTNVEVYITLFTIHDIKQDLVTRKIELSLKSQLIQLPSKVSDRKIDPFALMT
jgi:hypothetical protein